MQNIKVTQWAGKNKTKGNIYAKALKSVIT